MLQLGTYYSRHEALDDLATGGELAGIFGPLRLTDFRPQSAATTHFADLVLAGDAALTMIGSLSSDPPQRPQIVIPDRRVRSVAERWKGRNRGVRWHRIIGPVYDQPEHLGELRMVGEATVGLNALVITANIVEAELVMVAGAALVLPGVNVVAITPAEGLAMVAGAALALEGSEIFGSPELVMQGDADLRMRGTGGDNASVDPDQRRGGIVSIGVRGGHS